MHDTYMRAQDEAEPEREAADRLAHVHGEKELQAVLLALLLPAGSKRARRAWRVEAAGAADAEALGAYAAQLSGAARLPWFELLLARMAAQPLRARQSLLQAARRVMSARGVARPIDRLHWLTMRRGLGETGPLAARPEAGVDVAEWLETDVLAVALYSAFLSRMIPGDDTDNPQARAWYEAVMTTWQPFAEVPEWIAPGAEAMVEALGRLQTLSWMQRPVVVRNWVGTALRFGPAGRLDDGPADALRLSCGLLDSPLPPELAGHYVTLPEHLQGAQRHTQGPR